MKRRHQGTSARATALMFCTALLLLVIGCNQNQGNGGMNAKNIGQMSKAMADQAPVQRQFSEGRINVIKQDGEARQVILGNNLKEQQMVLQDQQLRKQMLDFNLKVNQLMQQDLKGKSQMMRSSVHINKAVMKDPELKAVMLRQHVASSKEISADPALRSEMSEAMLPLLKDPKIKAELEKMIKMAVAQAMRGLQAEPKPQPLPQQPQRQQQPSPQPQLPSQGTQAQQQVGGNQ